MMTVRVIWRTWIYYAGRIQSF